MFKGFSAAALACMQKANELAIEHRHTHISTEHVLLAIAQTSDIGQRVLESVGINDPVKLKEVIFTAIPHGDTTSPENASLMPSPHLNHVIVMAKGAANKRRATEVDTGDLLCGIAHESGCTALNLLHHIQGVDTKKIDSIGRAVAATRSEQAKPTAHATA